MRKIYFGFIACIIFSCNTSTQEKTAEAKDSAATTSETVKTVVDYPYPASYSSDWSIGDPENVKVVLEVYKAFAEDRVADIDKYLADTVSSMSFDALYEKLPKAKAIKELQDFRNTLKSVSEEFVAYVPLHSNDKNEDWVATWMKEKVVRKNGTKDSTFYVENWHFKDNKIVHRGGFAQYRGF